MRIAIGLITVIALAWSVYMGMAYWALLGDYWALFARIPLEMRIVSAISVLPVLALDAACFIMWKLSANQRALQP
jgi:hypothetical protein